MFCDPAHRFPAGHLAVALLLAVLPFEPRRPVVELPGMDLTALELAAALAGLVLVLERGLHRPRLPVLLLAAFGLVQVASALASPEPLLGLKFALRMLAGATFSALVMAAPPRASAFAGLAAGGGAVALLAVAELAGPGLDPFLAAFREMPFNVGGVRRASAGSEYPNLAAACIVYALIGVQGLLGSGSGGAIRGLAAGALGAVGILATYSRGALLGACLGLGAVALARGPGHRSAPLGSLAAVLVAGLLSLGGETFALRLASEGMAGWYGAVYDPADRALVLQPGERRLVSVRVTNTGRRTWTRAAAFHLSCHWYDPASRRLTDGERSDLPRDVAPGEGVLLRSELRAPASAGHYVLVWDMVQEHTLWFSGQGVPPALVPVQVGEAGPVPAAPLELGSAWRPGRLELWGLALRLWREHPLLGAGPDSFRRLHGPRAGHLAWDDRVRANSTPLEVAATSGALGVLTLFGALLTALRWSWRARLGPQAALAAALFGAGVAVLAHGLVDHVLAFTGHYLFLGWVVGACAALREPA